MMIIFIKKEATKTWKTCSSKAYRDHSDRACPKLCSKTMISFKNSVIWKINKWDNQEKWMISILLLEILSLFQKVRKLINRLNSDI